MLLMIHYDIWQKAGEFESLEKSINAIGLNSILVEEIKEVLEILIENIDYKEIPIKIPMQISNPERVNTITISSLIISFSLIF